eukprot:m.170638 g.170638  ORF g.170638 m.170638 type:complete len:452 (-) comp31616_c0_seq3:729-2084(-)
MNGNTLTPVGGAVNFKMIPSEAVKDNFWEIGTYKRVIKRIDEGALLVDEFKTLVQERAAIEKKYSMMLKDWSKKWETKVEKSPECPEYSIYKAWHKLISESNSLSKKHGQADTKLNDLANRHISTWKRANYPRAGRTKKGFKAAKQAEDGFAQAQNSWAKTRTKFVKSKKVWKINTKVVEACNKKMANPGNMSIEDKEKLQDKQRKFAAWTERNRFKCAQRLKDLEDDLPRYRHDMSEQFVFCQDIEQKRIDFLKHAMGLYIHSLVPDDSETNMPHKEVLAVIDEVNADADVLLYAQVNGDGMPLILPNLDLEDNPERRMSVVGVPRNLPHTFSSIMEANPECDDSNSDEEWDVDAAPPPPESLPRPENSDAKIVVALYEYKAAEKEELSLVVGDVITMLEDEDEQGWSKGIDKDGNIGFFPAHYVAVEGKDEANNSSSSVTFTESTESAT